MDFQLYRDPADPSALLGEGRPSKDTRPGKRAWSRQPQRPRPQPRSPREAPRAAPSKVRPPEVSERIWGLAEQWIETGSATLGRHPRVNQAEFAKRLKAKISHDPECHRVLNARGPEVLNDILSRTVLRFWDNLDIGQHDAVHQMLFLEDEWDSLLDGSITGWQVDWHKANSKPVSYEVEKRDDNRYLQVVRDQTVRAALEAAQEDPQPSRDRDGGGDLKDRWRQVRNQNL